MGDLLKNLNEDHGDFKEFCAFLQRASGITIAPAKAYLVSARIRQIMLKYEFASLADLLLALKKPQYSLQQEVVDAMTTNETFWFRDNYPFDYFYNTLLPSWNGESQHFQRPVRIWSAACSSGQEPYSLAMLIEEFARHQQLSKRFEILATDLSSEVLKQAKLGEYDQLSIGRGLSQARLQQFFSPGAQAQRGQAKWVVNNDLRKHIRFQAMNLLDSFDKLGKFDIIFCRNVLIYFDRETKTDIIKRMHQALNPGGYLCMGSSEGLGDASPLFSMVNCQPGLIYQAE